uniref:SelT-like protein n=1 Tax=Parastrongyloides trichosuri TaxID=131310 RepID=A0A0N4ZJ32_PARTI
MVIKTNKILLLFLFILSIHQLTPKESTNNEVIEDDGDGFEAFQEPEKDVEELDIRDPQGGVPKNPAVVPDLSTNLPGLRFEYCYSCGYKQAFTQYQTIILEKYPNIVIEGENYSPVYWKSSMAQIIGIIKFAFIFLIVTGKDPLMIVGISIPTLSNWLLTNKISSCMMIFMLSNMIEGMLMSTGAFEIFIGKERIWSKLESGRVPSPQELLALISQQLELSGAKSSNSFSQYNFNE